MKSPQLGPIELHPYGVYLPKRIKLLLIGSFPIGKFSNPKLKHKLGPRDIDFFYGGSTNQLWKIMARVFETDLSDQQKIEQLLQRQGIALADVIKSCQRVNGGGLDSQLKNICWHTELKSIIEKHKIPKLIFSSNQVEKWFRQHIDPQLTLPTLTLISPSAGGLRAFTKEYERQYLDWKKETPRASRREFRIEIYRQALG